MSLDTNSKNKMVESQYYGKKVVDAGICCMKSRISRCVSLDLADILRY